MGNDLAAMRVQTRFATTEAVIESVGASLTRGSLRVPVRIKAHQPFDVVLETSSGDEAVRGSAEVIGHAGDATWIRFLSAADNQGDDARWVLSDVKVVLQGSLTETTERKAATEQFEAITAVNSELQAIDAIRAGNAEPVPLSPLAPLMQVPAILPKAPVLPPVPAVAKKTKLDRRFDLSTGEAAPLRLAELTRSAGLAPKLQLAPLMDLSPKPDLPVVDLGLKTELGPKPEIALGSGIMPRVVERAKTEGDDLAIPVEPGPTVEVKPYIFEMRPAITLDEGKLAADVAKTADDTKPADTESEVKSDMARESSRTEPPPVANTPLAHAKTQPLPLMVQASELAPEKPIEAAAKAGDDDVPAIITAPRLVEPLPPVLPKPVEPAAFGDGRIDAKTTENAPLVVRKPEDPAVPLDGAPKAVITEEAEPMVMEPESSTRPTEQQEPLRLEIKSDAMKPLAMPLGAASVVVTMTPSDATTPAPIPRTPVAAITAGLDLDQTTPNESPVDEREPKRPYVTDQIARERGIRPITQAPRRAPLQPRPIMIACAGIAGACMIATISTIVWARGAVSEARAHASKAQAAAAMTPAAAPVAAGTPVAAATAAPVAARPEPVAPVAAAPSAVEPMTASEPVATPPDNVEVVEPVAVAPAPQPAAAVEPARCSLSVSANIAGSTIYIDGKSHGKAPAEITAACDVPVSVEVRHPRYENFTSTVTPSGGTVEIAATLEREKTTVTVTSDPPAQVTYNGKVIGTTPLTTKVPRFEQSTLYFKARGMATDWRRIVPKTATKTVSVTLKKK